MDLLANANVDAPQGLHDGLDGAPRVLVLIHERALPLGEILRGHGPVKGPQHACPRKVQAPSRVARIRCELQTLDTKPSSLNPTRSKFLRMRARSQALHSPAGRDAATRGIGRGRMYWGANPGPGRPPGRDGHRAVRPPEPPSGRQNGGSAERNDYHAATGPSTIARARFALSPPPLIHACVGGNHLHGAADIQRGCSGDGPLWGDPQMLQLQMLQMQRMGQLMTLFAQTQQQNWDMAMPNMQNMQHMYPGMGMPSMQNMQNMQHMYPREGEREGERERERERDRESRRARGGDAGGYRRDNHGQKVNGPSRRNVEIK